jgi:hypothetical protein
VKTTAGPVVLERPKLRGTAQPFASRLFGKGVSRTNALEALVISGFVRGLSTRDVEAALGEVLGRASRGWRGVVMTPAAVRLLQELRRQLNHPSRLEEVVDQTVTPAA